MKPSTIITAITLIVATAFGWQGPSAPSPGGGGSSSPTVRELERADRDGRRPHPVTIPSQDSSLVPALTISLNPTGFL